MYSGNNVDCRILCMASNWLNVNSNLKLNSEKTEVPIVKGDISQQKWQMLHVFNDVKNNSPLSERLCIQFEYFKIHISFEFARLKQGATKPYIS